MRRNTQGTNAAIPAEDGKTGASGFEYTAGGSM
jgi:hypothetical protein